VNKLLAAGLIAQASKAGASEEEPFGNTFLFRQIANKVVQSCSLAVVQSFSRAVVQPFSQVQLTGL
jgi:hypothetical protein